MCSCGQLQDSSGDESALDLLGSAHHALRATVEIGTKCRVISTGIAGTGDRERGMADRLLDLRHQQLVDRSLWAVRYAVQPFRQTPADVKAQHLGFDQRPRHVGESVALVSLRLGT